VLPSGMAIRSTIESRSWPSAVVIRVLVWPEAHSHSMICVFPTHSPRPLATQRKLSNAQPITSPVSSYPGNAAAQQKYLLLPPCP
jgi:hypothetical protein